jgi:hypothetical protein
MKLLGLVSVDFDVTDQTLCIHQLFENKRKYSDTVHQVFIDFKKTLNSVRSELLNKILPEFGIVTSCRRRFCPVQF